MFGINSGYLACLLVTLSQTAFEELNLDTCIVVWCEAVHVPLENGWLLSVLSLKAEKWQIRARVNFCSWKGLFFSFNSTKCTAVTPLTPWTWFRGCHILNLVDPISTIFWTFTRRPFQMLSPKVIFENLPIIICRSQRTFGFKPLSQADKTL